MDRYTYGWMDQYASAGEHLPMIKYLLEKGGSDVTDVFTLISDPPPSRT